MLSRYPESVLDMDAPTVIRLCIKALDANKRAEIRQQWVAMLPYMSLGQLQYISFDEYYDKCTGANIDMRPAEDILAEVAEIEKELAGVPPERR